MVNGDDLPYDQRTLSLFRPLELHIANRSADPPFSSAASAAATAATAGSTATPAEGSAQACAETPTSEPSQPISLEHALSIFWRESLLRPDSLLMQLPPPHSSVEPHPPLPPPAPLPPTDDRLREAAGGDAAALEASLARLQALGSLLLLSLAQGVPLPRWLPPSVLRALLGRPADLSLADLQACLPPGHYHISSCMLPLMYPSHSPTYRPDTRPAAAHDVVPLISTCSYKQQCSAW